MNLPTPTSAPLTKFEKLRFGVYFKSRQCACGGRKKANSWNCAPCKAAFRETPEGIALKAACQAHLKAGAVIIAKCRARAASAA